MTQDSTTISMNSIEAVLRLLVLTVHADCQSKPQELDEVWRQIPKLRIFTDNKGFPDADGFGDLIETFDAQLSEHRDRSSLLSEVEDAIHKIDSPTLAPIVLTSMRVIAYADHEYHPTERTIIDRAAEVWGLASGSALYME